MRDNPILLRRLAALFAAPEIKSGPRQISTPKAAEREASANVNRSA
jgi:hypothetical protein